MIKVSEKLRRMSSAAAVGPCPSRDMYSPEETEHIDKQEWCHIRCLDCAVEISEDSEMLSVDLFTQPSLLIGSNNTSSLDISVCLHTASWHSRISYMIIVSSVKASAMPMCFYTQQFESVKCVKRASIFLLSRFISDMNS